MSTAVVIDGAYFLRRFSYAFPDLDSKDPDQVTSAVLYLASWHLWVRYRSEHLEIGEWAHGFLPCESPTLYRIFFYDCPPLAKRMHLPVSRRAIDFAKTEVAITRHAIHTRLLDARKVALRLGRLNEDVVWVPKQDAYKRWAADGFLPTDDDFEISVTQKGVDMRLGLDVAAMAFKRQVDQIVLVAGDADFVPAVKLARREGIDVVLDPMGGKAARDLLDHVDGVRQCRMSTEAENQNWQLS